MLHTLYYANGSCLPWHRKKKKKKKKYLYVLCVEIMANSLYATCTLVSCIDFAQTTIAFSIIVIIIIQSNFFLTSFILPQNEPFQETLDSGSCWMFSLLFLLLLLMMLLLLLLLHGENFVNCLFNPNTWLLYIVSKQKLFHAGGNQYIERCCCWLLF